MIVFDKHHLVVVLARPSSMARARVHWKTFNPGAIGSTHNSSSGVVEAMDRLIVSEAGGQWNAFVAGIPCRNSMPSAA
eukprot:1426106-Amphidinium_carterae.1